MEDIKKPPPGALAGADETVREYIESLEERAERATELEEVVETIMEENDELRDEIEIMQYMEEGDEEW